MNFEPNSLTHSQIREEEQIAEVEEGASDGEGPPEELTSQQIEAEVTAEAAPNDRMQHSAVSAPTGRPHFDHTRSPQADELEQ